MLLSIPLLSGNLVVRGSLRKLLSEVLMLSKRQRSLIEEAVALEFEDAKSSGATGYLPHFLAQATLPHKDPKCMYFERGTSNLTLSILAHPKYGMPYGMMPRLLLAWMCTEACRTSSPELSLGRNQNEFLKKLQLPSDGRYIKALHAQTVALIRAQLSVEVSKTGVLAFESIQIAKNGFVFWNPKRPDEECLWNSTLTLGSDFYGAITKAPVPLKIEALQALRQSPLAMDIYTWLVYRMFTLNVAARSGRNKEAKIPWVGLKCQFGGGYEETPQGVRSFKANFLKQLRGVLLYYPDARNYIEETPEHFVLKAGARPVVQQRVVAGR
ncbi:TPA: RepA [Pseudomonas aeruginosa]|nr:RepA [Pseudomonas aeruginosa]